ncbi:hypothetical protein DFQ28_011318 [Apophysomyces sp. BC1034]|nr:hypothetical protein DFQ30_011125 [Apophysomyces sp. BC1015]KAG0178460.1 hypothetical protein DFQ29_003436 [Apophysomyces sp. BC1021]KAG0184361.1 hypothetical protein DFQ28_011318 [Apophysomyces sp. BC1034]
MDYPFDVCILASYFVVIFILLWRVENVLGIAWQHKNLVANIFFLLALLSFGATWTYMFKYFQYSYDMWSVHHKDIAPEFWNKISHWLHDSSLFDDAWRTVSLGVWPWIWSLQLCNFTVAVWTPFLAIESVRRGIRYPWAFMLLGQVVAISVASALFFAVAWTMPRFQYAPSRTSGAVLMLSVIGGCVTVVMSPFVANTVYFMPNLLVMHALLIFPLVSNTEPDETEKRKHGSHLVMTLYTAAAGANFAIYVAHCFECLMTLSSIWDILPQLVCTFLAHPAQSSISADIVFVNLISIAWIVVNGRETWHWYVAGLTPFLSASVTLPLFLAGQEYDLIAFKLE